MNKKNWFSAVLMAFVMAPGIAPAQSADDAWRNLSRLRPGQKVVVADMQLKTVSGKFADFSEDAISVLVGSGRISIPRSDVFSVKNGEGSHRSRNTLLGLAIGAAAGAAAGASHAAYLNERGEFPVYLLVWTPIGAGAGAVVGAVLPAGPVTIYRAKARTRSNP